MAAPKYRKPTGRRPGKPSKYDDLIPHNLDAISGLARRGETQEEIAKKLGISPGTLIVWKSKYPELAAALKVGKDLADADVEAALYRSAVGYRYKTQQVTAKGDVVDVELWQAPNTTAQIFWLKNRRPEVWRDKQELVHNVGDELAKLIEESMSTTHALPAGDIYDVDVVDVGEVIDSESGIPHQADLE